MRITKAQAKKLGDKLGVDWNKIDLEQFHMGCNVEKEHRPTVGNKPLKFASISRDHLKEGSYKNKRYYSLLKKVDPHERPKKTVKKTVRKKK